MIIDIKQIEEVKYHKLTTLLFKVKFSIYLMNFLFYLFLRDRVAISGLIVDTLILTILLLIKDRFFNLTRVLITVYEFLFILTGFLVLSFTKIAPMPISVYIIIIVELLSQIFIPIIIFDYKTEKRYIIPIFIFYLLMFLFIDDFIYYTTGPRFIDLIHKTLTLGQWKITLLLPFLGFMATLAMFIRQISMNESVIKNYNDELKATLEELQTTQHHLIQADKMASLGTLTAGIAHEINNPLNFINGGVIGLEDYMKEKNADFDVDTLFYFDSMKTGVKRVSDIVKGLNQFNRSSEISVENCDIHTIIDNVLVMLQSCIKNKIEVRKNFTSKKFILQGNEGRLHQVMLNILNNSCQAIHENGSITISTKVTSTHLVIEIADTGSGISPEIISKIMNPFFSTKEVGQGVGLGLYITYSIIKEHKGDLVFQSEVGKWTKATITLPISKMV